MSALFTPLQVGPVHLAHRVVMAPLTRFRADDTNTHHEVAAEYYEQRTTPGGLIISEATYISSEAGGQPNAPGIWTDEQVAAWKVVVDRVHSKAGFIFLQLWALGRAAEPDVIHGLGHKFVGASAIPVEEGGEAPEALTREDIYRYVENYAQAAKNAIKAGFDGVEVHNANGYLLDQFLQTNSNQRMDEFGGSIENRARFTLLVAKAVSDAIGEDKVGFRFSPYGTYLSMRMEDPIPTFNYVVKELRDRFPKLAYMHFVEGRVSGSLDTSAPASENSDFARTVWNAKGERPFFSAGGYGYKTELAEQTVEAHGGAAVFGRAFIANPDLIHRIKNKLLLNHYDRATFYFGKGPRATEGYLDYPLASTEVIVQA